MARWLVVVAVLAGVAPSMAAVHVKPALAATMTSDELAGHVAALEAVQTSAPPPALPADTCTAATYETTTLPYTTPSDTTVGQADDFDLPSDVTDPTCTAPTPCTGGGEPGSLPRGAVYTGTGTGPDRAYRIRVDQSCTLAITATPESSWDLSLIVYEAACSSSLADCACVDDSELDEAPESVSLDAVAGTDYFIVVDGYGLTPGPGGPFHVSITETTATGCQLIDPNPTTTTTSTSTLPPSTTTTLPSGCDTVPIDSSFASLACRLDGAIAEVASLPTPLPKLGAALGRARTFVQAAVDFCLAENAKKGRKHLAKAVRKIVRARRLIRKASSLDPAVQAEMVAEAQALLGDLRARRSALSCPADAG